MLPKKYIDLVGREVIQWVRTKLTGTWLELDYETLSIGEQKALDVLRQSGAVECRVQLEASRDDGSRYSAKGVLTGVWNVGLLNWYLLQAVPSWFENNREKKPIKRKWDIFGARLTLYGLHIQKSKLDDERVLFSVDQQVPGTLDLKDDRIWYDHSINVEAHAHAEVNAAFQNNNNFAPVYAPEVKVENHVHYPPGTTGASPKESGDGTSIEPQDEETNLRPAYCRDHLWLDWYEDDNLKPAAIRDRWNAMPDEKRAKICPACSRIINTEKGNNGLDTVKTALRTARAERKSENKSQK